MSLLSHEHVVLLLHLVCLVLLVHRLCLAWIVHMARLMRTLDMIHMSSLLGHLVLIASHVLGVRLIALDGPPAFLHLIQPVFEIAFLCGRLWNLSLVHHVGVEASRLLLEFAIHKLPSVPVLLSARGQSFAAVNPHDMAGYFLGAIDKKDGKKLGEKLTTYCSEVRKIIALATSTAAPTRAIGILFVALFVRASSSGSVIPADL